MNKETHQLNFTTAYILLIDYAISNTFKNVYIITFQPYINMLWSSPLQISICTYFLYQTLGASVLAGLLGKFSFQYLTLIKWRVSTKMLLHEFYKKN